MDGLILDDVCYSRGKPILQHICCQFDTGTTSAVIGASGSGKSTLLRLIAGLERPDYGTISYQNQVFHSFDQHMPPRKRRVGMVFQDYALFPHLNAVQNIAFALNNPSKSAAMELLELVDLRDKAASYPHELSGGQQQRVAVARALAAKPDIMLLDEPFSGLDDTTRQQVRKNVFDVLNHYNITVVMVTHCAREAAQYAQYLVLLENGHIKWQGDLGAHLDLENLHDQTLGSVAVGDSPHLHPVH